MTGPKNERDLAPSEVRERIHADHERIRHLLDHVREHSGTLKAGSDDKAFAALNEHAHNLLDVMLIHIDLEDRILAPALRDTDAFGPVRADRLVSEHVLQRSHLRELLEAVRARELDAQSLAERMTALVEMVQADMESEEKDLLNQKLLNDEPGISDTFVG